MRGPAPHALLPSKGFTLIELVMVITMVGALAVFALPRLVDTEMWRLRAFSDDLQSQMQAMLRLSLVQRRPITASLSGTGASFSYTATGQVLASLSCPATSSPCISPAAPVSITFNSGNSGRSLTSSGAALPVSVSGSTYGRDFVLENETGLFYTTP